MRYHTRGIICGVIILFHLPFLLWAQESSASSTATRTIVAEILMIDGDFYVVRGERGEIRIEVTPDTKVSEPFQFGDRIKAVVSSSDTAISIERAGESEPLGITMHQAAAPPSDSASPIRSQDDGQPQPASPSQGEDSETTAPEPVRRPTIRIVVAEILMVDGDFYVVRSEAGEIRIEVTPDTKLEGTFKFGDRIKAEILPNDKAISVESANPDEPNGISTFEQVAPPRKPQSPSKAQSSEETPPDPVLTAKTPKIRTIVAEILMVDGDFYVVRGERGEIRITVTPDTKLSEEFKFGDKIKAKVLPSDEAISVERAGENEPVGITESP